MTHPTPTPASDAAAVDQTLADRATSSGQWIAGLIAAAMLDTTGTPAKLPELTFADLNLPDETITRIWQAGLAVGYRAGLLASRPRFHRDTLTRLQNALHQAGHRTMGRLTAQTLTVLPPAPVHPADTDRDTVRGGHE